MTIPNISPLTKDYKLPSNNKKVRVRPYNVKEEESLMLAATGDDRQEIFNCVIDLLKACILTSDVEVEKLPLFDIEYLFVQLRALAVGNNVRGFVICKDDKATEVPYSLDYSSIKITKNSNHNKTIKLSDQYVVEMNYPGVDTFIDKVHLITKGKERELKTNEYIAKYINRIYKGDEIYDRPTQTDKDYEEFLDHLTPQERRKISKFFETMPKLEHKFTVINPKTNVESEYEMGGLEAFFLFQPSEE